jgi:hypothetical protein
VILTGPAGTGKTALAVHTAHRLAGRYPDGVVMARLRADDGSPRPRASVLAELARALGCPRPPAADGDDPDEATAVWRTWLCGRRVLLLLDDAGPEADADVAALLPPAGPGAALVTTRAGLAGLEPARHIALPPFGPAEALELLARITGPARPAAEPEAARRIVTATGLLPLAVRVAGKRLAVLRHMPLAEYAGRLENPHETLDELAAGGLSVRVRLADAWQRLPAPARATLRGLAALPGPVFTLPQAAAALGLPPGRAERALELLIEAGVLGQDAAEADDGPEVHAHGALIPYELPRLTQLFAREQPC